VPSPNSGTTAPPVTVPVPPTQGYQPYYPSESEQAHAIRAMQSGVGSNSVAHEPIEADRR
jgi:hypothetical protein